MDRQSLSEPTSLQLEFRTIAALTGRPELRAGVDKVLLKTECMLLKAECMLLKIECMLLKIECMLLKIECMSDLNPATLRRISRP